MGCTDKEIAESLGLTASGYSKVKNNKRRVPVEYLEMVADFFEVPFSYLFFTESDLNDISFAEEIQEYAQEHQLNNQELADKLGINVVRVMELARGGNPTKEEIEKVAPKLGIEINEQRLRDGRMDLLKLILKELGLEESKREIVMEFIEGQLEQD